MTAEAPRSWIRQVGQAALIGVLYYAAGRLALLLAIPPGYAAAVWPAAGIALAGVLSFGYRVWPGILVGSFLLNLSTALDTTSGASVVASIMLAGSIGVGASLEAVVGAFLARRFSRFPNSLSDERDVITFLVLGGPVSCVISATVGVTSLWTAQAIQSDHVAFSWATWWVGDTLGALVFTPLILVWTVTPRQYRRIRALAVSVPLAVMFALAVLLFVRVSRWEEHRIRTEFDNRAHDLAQTIERHFSRSLDVVHVLQTLFASAATVDPQEFHQFARGMLSRHSGIQALSWNPVVREADRDSWEMMARKEGNKDFQITELNARRELTPSPRRAEYVPVARIEPYEGNERALGYDITSDIVRNEALVRARDSGSIQASAPIALVQDRRSDKAVLVLAPIYQSGVPHVSPAERRQNVRGYTSVVFRVPEMMRAALEHVNHAGMDIRLYDGDASSPPVLLVERVARSTGSATTNIPRLAWRTGFDLAGRRWVVSFASSDDQLGAQRSFQAWIVPAGGLVCTGLLGALLLVVTGRTARIQELVQQRTAERTLAQRRLAVQYSVTSALAEGSTLDEGAAKVIAAICEGTRWEIGLLWTVDRSANVLRCSKSWRLRPSGSSELEFYSHAATFTPGSGLPGRVWQSGQPAWIPDLLRDGNFPRARYAEADGLRAGLGVPIRVQHETIGVLEFFDRETREPDPELLDMIVAACGQIGQFIHRKQEETARAHVAAIVASSEDAIVGLGLDGVITSWNRGAARIYQYSSAEVIGRSINTLVAAEHAADTPDIVATLHKRKIEHQETAHVRKDGSLIDVAITFSPILDVNGITVGASAISRDITTEKRARQALRESEQRLELALSGGDLGLWDSHLTTGRVVFNDRWAQMLGYDANEIEHRVGAWERLLHPDDAPRVLQAFNDHLAGETPYYECEYRLRTKPGNWKWIFSRGKVVERDADGKPRRVTGTHLDIEYRKRTEEARRQAEQALLNAELRFRSLTQSSADAILSADDRGNILSWNSGAERMFGYREEELLGRPLTLIMPPQYRDAHSEGLARRRASGDARVIGKTVELWGLKKDGTEFPLELSLSAWTTPDEELFGGIIRDITDRRRTAAELAQARDAALESTRLKSEFLANMSHEIRTPMNAIIGLSSLLLDTGLNAEQRDFAETVHHSAEALLVLANDILDFSKIEAGKLDLDIVDFDLRELVEECVQTNAERADRRGLDLACLIRDGVPMALRGDPVRIRQVLLNLVGNAIKFTEQGGVTVRVGVIAVHADAATIHVEVVDTGIGVPPEARERIFNSFTQADGSMTRKYGGTGLGLAISKQLVDLMGGEIGFDSEPDKGSTFWFNVKLTTQPTRIDAAASSRQELSGVRVLIVDDNPINREILTLFAGSWGMHADQAEDGRTALARLSSGATEGHPFDIAILDLELPDMSGLALAHAITSDATTASVKLALMTSLSQRAHVQTARQHGIYAHFTKPVRQSQVFDCLTAVASSSVMPAATRSSIQPTVIPSVATADPILIGPILVAEDNPVNQKVAIRQLEKLGYKADVAANGREVLEALARTRYPLVLMDVQMPEMDGFEATAEIRRREGSNHHTPIIAMTAHTMIGEREKCLQAGMDDYLGKPVKLDDLATVLRRWMAETPASLT